jgi:hypothetical protein
MKYIRHKKLGFILFEGKVPHVEVAQQLGGVGEVESAGFVFAPDMEVRCLGHSGTLDVGTAPYDSADLRSRMKAF